MNDLGLFEISILTVELVLVGTMTLGCCSNVGGELSFPELGPPGDKGPKPPRAAIASAADWERNFRGLAAAGSSECWIPWYLCDHCGL